MAISKTQLYVQTSTTPLSSAVKPVYYGSNKVWSIYRGRDLVWKMCKVKFVDWNGDLLKEEEVVFGHSAPRPSDPSREGYVFDGWYPPYTNIRCNTEVSAQYHQQPQQLHLSIDVFPPGTGTVVGAGPHDPGQRVTVNAIPNPGCVFQSWSDGGSQSHVVLMDQDKHLTAYFSTSGCLVRFLDWDGSLLKSQVVEYGGNATPPPNLEREGYTFTDWSGSYLSVTTSRDIIAQYAANVYTITFDPCGGTVDPISTAVEFDSEYGELPTPERDETLTSYFEFVNWIDSYNEPVYEDTPFTTASDQTLSAEWIELPKMSVLRVQLGSHVLSVDCLYNGAVDQWYEVSSDTDLSVFLSSEWRAYAKAESGYIPYWTESTPLISTKGPDLETVVFKVKPIITWDSHGGTTVQPWNDRGAGEELGDLPNTERDGYAFAGWWTDEISGDEISSSTLVGDEDTTYHAHWVADDIITEVNSVFQTNSLDTNTISYQNKAYGYVYWNDNAGQVLPVWQPTLDKVFDNEEYLSQSLSGVHGTARAGSSSVDFTNGGRAGIVLSAMTPKSENSSLYTKVKILPYIVTNSYSTGGAIRQNGWYYTDRRPAPTAYGQNSDWSMNTNDSTGYLHFGYATYNRGQYFQVIMDVADEDGDHQISSDIVQCTGSYSTLDGQRSGSPSDVAPITIDLSQKIVDVGLKKDARTTKITFKQGTSSTAPQWAAAVNAVCLYEDTLNG